MEKRIFEFVNENANEDPNDLFASIIKLGYRYFFEMDGKTYNIARVNTYAISSDATSEELHEQAMKSLLWLSNPKANQKWVIREVKFNSEFIELECWIGGTQPCSNNFINKAA